MKATNVATTMKWKGINDTWGKWCTIFKRR